MVRTVEIAEREAAIGRSGEPYGLFLSHVMTSLHFPGSEQPWVHRPLHSRMGPVVMPDFSVFIQRIPQMKG